MTPSRRRPATPASQGPTRTAPDVPIAPSDPAVPDDEAVLAPLPPASTKEGTTLLGPGGEPIAEEAPTDASADAAPPTEAGSLEDRAATPSPPRPLALYPLPVWPD